MSELIKVCLVCDFSNPMVRSHLPLDNRSLYNFVRRLFGMPKRLAGYGDTAAWDTYLIDYLSRRSDVDLSVIVSHPGLKKGTVSFYDGNVYYQVIRCEIATALKRIIKNPALWVKLNPMRPKVRRLIRRIRPDIVALIGAENAHISSTVLGIKDVPVLIQCQTIYNNPNRIKYGRIDIKNAFVEKEIFRTAKYVALPTWMHYNLYKTMAGPSLVFDWKAKTPLPKKINYSGPKEYDFVNFALTMDLRKGFHDSIRALAIVKKQYPNVRLNLIGRSTAERKSELVALVDELSLQDNVVFTSFFPHQDDLFLQIQKSRFALLPSKMDYVSGTMVQAMHFGLPLVCYATEGTPLLNSEKECVLLATMNSIEQLAAQMLELMSDSEKADLLRRNAMEWVEKNDNMATCTERLVNTYKAIIDYDKSGKTIPEYLSFNPDAL